MNAETDGDIDTSFEEIRRLSIPAIIVAVDTFFVTRREKLVALAAKYAVPTMYSLRDFAASGRLMSYGIDLHDMYRQAGVYAGRSSGEACLPISPSCTRPSSSW